MTQGRWSGRVGPKKMTFRHWNDMPSGYEKYPDYGGRQPKDWEPHAWVAGFIAIIALVAWWSWTPAAECKPVDPANIETRTDGKSVMVLKSINPGDCVSVDTGK